MHRAHEDDRSTAPARDHPAHRGAGAQKSAVEVYRQQLLPVSEAELRQRRDDLDAGVADQHVQPAEFGDGAGNRSVDAGLVGHVDRHGECADALRAQRGSYGLGAAQVQVGDRDGRPGPSIDLCDALADAAGRAGHECHLVVESHVLLLHRKCLLSGAVQSRTRNAPGVAAEGAMRRARSERAMSARPASQCSRIEARENS